MISTVCPPSVGNINPLSNHTRNGSSTSGPSRGSQTAGGKGNRVLGMFPGEARFVDAVKPIRESLKDKTKRYGELPHPLLVALNVNAMSLDKADEMQALFGMEGVRLDGGEYSSLIDQGHTSKGVWSAPDRLPSTMASGAWIFNAVNLWNLIANKATVYFNPRSAKALPHLFTTAESRDRKRWESGVARGTFVAGRTRFARKVAVGHSGGTFRKPVCASSHFLRYQLC